MGLLLKPHFSIKIMFKKFNLTPWLFLAPAFVYFFIMVVYPIGGSFWISFHHWDGTKFQCSDGRSLKSLDDNEICRRVPKMEFAGLENYKRFFKKSPRDIDKILDYWGKVFDPRNKGIGVPIIDQVIGLTITMSDGETIKWPRLSVETKVMLNTLKWLIFFPLAIPIGLALAVFLNQIGWFVKLSKSLLFFPFVISSAVIGFVFQFFYDPNGGLLSPLYELLGWKDGIIGDKDKATYGIILAAWYRQIGYCLIIYLAGLTSVNSEQIEAARMDGAFGWKLFRYIVLPQLWPATFIAVVVTIIGALRTDSFDMTQIMTEGGPGRGASDVMSRYMYQKTLFDQDYGYGSTISVLLFMFMLIFIITFIIRMYYQDENLR